MVAHIVRNVVLAIIGVVLVFLLVGNLAPTLSDSADNISNSGLPLASLFTGSGVVMIIFMVGILLGIVGLVLKKKGMF